MKAGGSPAFVFFFVPAANPNRSRKKNKHRYPHSETLCAVQWEQGEGRSWSEAGTEMAPRPFHLSLRRSSLLAGNEERELPPPTHALPAVVFLTDTRTNPAQADSP